MVQKLHHHCSKIAVLRSDLGQYNLPIQTPTGTYGKQRSLRRDFSARLGASFWLICKGSRRYMSLIAVGTLFPAIPLAIVALNFRYTSLAGLMRQITSQLDASTPNGPGQAVLIDELSVMKKRMTLVKYALFLCGVAFIFNLAALYLGYFSLSGMEPVMMALTILSMIGGISCFCVETILSTKALNLHISGVLHRDATGRDGRA
jgi:hypothetical protein